MSFSQSFTFVCVFDTRAPRPPFKLTSPSKSYRLPQILGSNADAHSVNVLSPTFTAHYLDRKHVPPTHQQPLRRSQHDSPLPPPPLLAAVSTSRPLGVCRRTTSRHDRHIRLLLSLAGTNTTAKRADLHLADMYSERIDRAVRECVARTPIRRWSGDETRLQAHIPGHEGRS